jgi:hypothetical protein
MSHTPNELDVKTDLRRSVMASYSTKKFADTNFKVFLDNAQKNLELLKEKIGMNKYIEVRDRILKSQDSKMSAEKRREDLLTASLLI